MNLKDWAKANNMTIPEAKEATGLKHWNATVPDEPSTTSTEEVKVAPKVTKPVAEKKDGAKQWETDDLELIRLSLNGAGNKSPYWHLRHLVGRK